MVTWYWIENEMVWLYHVTVLFIIFFVSLLGLDTEMLVLEENYINGFYFLDVPTYYDVFHYVNLSRFWVYFVPYANQGMMYELFI